MNRTLILRLCLIAAALLLAKAGWDRVEDDIGMMLIYFVALGVIGGVLIVLYVLPRFGDAVGTLVYSSGEKITDSGGLKAAAKLAQGDYEGAIAEHEKELAAQPLQTHPIAEIAKICAEKLGDPQRARQVLKTHLQNPAWPEDDAAFLRFRLVDLEMHHFKDLATARTLLEQIIADFPNTRHSGNAHHKIHELEQAEYHRATTKRGGTGHPS